MLPFVNRIAGGLLVVTGGYVAYYGTIEIRAGSGATSGVVDRLGGWSSGLSTWVQDVGAGLIGVVLAALTVGVTVVVLVTQRRALGPRPPRRAASAAGPVDACDCDSPAAPVEARDLVTSRSGAPDQASVRVESCTVDANKALVERLVDTVINGGDLDALDDMCTPTLAAKLRRAFGEFRTAFPDWRQDLVELVAEGDTVVARFRCTGTHRGAWQGLAATGRRMRIDEVYFFRVTDGRISGLWGLEDTWTRMRQLQGRDAHLGELGSLS